MTKSEAENLGARMRDYIPGGKPVDVLKLTFRPTHDHEVHLCGTKTGDDIQSGPYYCGAVAEWVARTAEGHWVAVCDLHGRQAGIRRETPVATRNELQSL